ncbi:MAG: CoA pyrophosphatase [archaeon]
MEALKTSLGPIGREEEPESKAQQLAAVTMILDPLEEEMSLLLVRRTARQDDPWSGQMAFPGGHMTDQDSSLVETAIRETLEEVGINLHEHELLGTISDVRSTRRGLVITPFVASLKYRVKMELRKDEITEAMWIPISYLARTTAVKRRVKTSEGEVEVEGIPYSDQFIWGLTFRMIGDFLPRLDRI